MMKGISLIAAGAVCFLNQVAIANPVRTEVADIYGTKFIVSVDWEANTVSAKLRANPTHLSGDALEQAMQNAVYFGAAVNCRMLAPGRKRFGQSEIMGVLHCPWFDRTPLKQS